MLISSSSIFAGLIVGSESTINTDGDGSCQLLNAECDHSGITITFNKTCQAEDFQAVQWGELFANGTIDASAAVFGTNSTYPTECRFSARVFTKFHAIYTIIANFLFQIGAIFWLRLMIRKIEQGNCKQLQNFTLFSKGPIIFGKISWTP